MKRFRVLSLLLAAALQVMPYCRTLITTPAAQSTFAVIFRWTVGATAALGAYDAVSGATTVYYTTPTNFTGTVGTYFTNFVAITNNGGDPGAYFVLTNTSGISAALPNGSSTTVCMPPGLTFKCVDLNNGSTPKLIYGAIFGTPTTAVTNHRVHVLCGFTGQIPAETNIYFTFTPAVAAQSPIITNQPTGTTNVAGSTVGFTVVAGGTAPLTYQWRFVTTNITGATNASLSLANIRMSQAGDYFVVITNVGGAITSATAKLGVTLPAAPTVTASPNAGSGFRFTFTPVVGLTNAVQTNGTQAGGTWATMTNIPPPTTAASITITDTPSAPLRFYRVRVDP